MINVQFADSQPDCADDQLALRMSEQTAGGRKRIKVLLLVRFVSRFGGAERLTSALATHLPSDRFETWVCATRGGEEPAVRALQEAGVHYVDLGRRGRFDLYRMLGLARILRRERFDVIHSHMFGINVWGTIFGRAFHVPVLIAHEHTWSYEGGTVRRWLDGQLIGRATTRFVAVSSADAARMVSLEGVPAEKVVQIPTAYIPSPSSPPGDLRAELGLSADTPLVAIAVVLRPQKSVDVLLYAHQYVLREVPAAHLVIAGDGERREALEQLARDLGIAGSVHFLGMRTDIDSVIGSADVCALSSDFEGLPLYAFECMANRTPLVATDVGGLPDVIDNGRTGLLVPRQDPGALGIAIAELLRDPDRRDQIVRAALIELDRYTISRTTQRFADLYEDLVAEASP
jgi:glycosyltransferase involved in cell wall biosynthesis